MPNTAPVATDPRYTVNRDVWPEPPAILTQPRLKGSGRLLHEIAAARAERTPDDIVLEFTDGASHTAAELDRAGATFAGALQRVGVRPGDRVAVMLDNRVEYVAALLGTSRSGGVCVPVNTAMRGDILTYQLAQTAPRVLVVQDSYVKQARDALTSVDSIDSIVVIGEASDWSGGPTTVAYGEFVADAPAPVSVEMEPWDLAGIFYTSGTTGPSKGVMWTHNFCVTFCESAQWVLGLRKGDVSFTALPLFHGNGLFLTLFPAILFDGRAVVAGRFSVSRFWTQVKDSRATVASLLGAMGQLLASQPPSPLEREHDLRLALVIPNPSDTHAFETRFGVPATQLYGLSDCGIVIGVPFGIPKPAASGIPLPGWECRLVDEFDEDVTPGKPGELIVRPQHSYRLPLGYWQMPEATLESRRNLWMHTGDLMRQDEDGWYYFLDRAKDSIRRSGENISSYEVEQVMSSHPGVAEVCVFAVPSDLAEDEVMAAVVLHPGVSLTPSELADYCEPRLPYFAVPRYYDFVESIPKTETAKVQKHLLRAAGITPTAWDRGPSNLKRRMHRETAAVPGA